MKDYKKTLSSKICGMCVLAMLASISIYAHSAEVDQKQDTDDKTSANPYQKSFKVDLPKDVHFIYVGAGLSNKLLNIILEKPTQYGNFYTKVGQYNEGNGVAGLVGYRYPYLLTKSQAFSRKKSNNNGIYVGVFGGHVMNIRDNSSDKDDKRFNRLGVGADISYLWFDASRIGALSLGMFLPERKKLSDDTVKEMKPELMLSFSLSAGLF